MTFIKRKGRTTFSVGKRGPRMSYRLGCAVPILALLLVALLAGCGGSSATTEPTERPTPRATPRPTPSPEPEAAWPVEWGDDVCAVFTMFGIAAQDLRDMQQAAQVGDLEDVSLQAYGVVGLMESSAILLAGLERWEPGAAVVAALAETAEAYGGGATLIDDGITAVDSAMVEQGWARVTEADAIAARASAEIDALEAETGFDC